MKRRALRAAAAGFALLAMAYGMAQGARLRCADEYNACVSACSKRARSPLGACVRNCQARQAACRESGCRNNGTHTYCGLLRR
jgi:hypothetical protein